MALLVLGTAESMRFDVLGQTQGSSGVVTHIGLAVAPSLLSRGVAVDTLDMGIRQLNLDPPGRFAVDVWGSLPLTRDEQEGIEDWLAAIRPRVASCRYLALPAASLRRDPISGQIVSWDFSCAGFVVTAYERGAGVLLVSQESLPMLTRAQAIEIWGQSNERLFDRYASTFGLVGEGPWPVLTPGYVMNALRAGREGLPHHPQHSELSIR